MWFWEERKDHREQGNEHYKQHDLDAAIACYSEGLAQLVGSAQAKERAVLLSNRSAAFASMQRWKEALGDADEAVQLSPDYVKAWGRKGRAHFALKEYQKAATAYAKGLDVALKRIDDDSDHHANQLKAITSQATSQTKEYQRLLDENSSLKQQLDDYSLVFDKDKVG